MVEHGDMRGGRRNLRQHLQPFAGHRPVIIGEARDVAAGVRETGDKTLVDRVGDHR